MLRTQLSYLILALFVGLSACGSPLDDPANIPGDSSVKAPHISALDRTSVRVGETLHFFGSDFLTPDQGRTYLEFEGTFFWENDNGDVVPEHVPPFVVAGVYDGVYEDGVRVGGVDLQPGTDAVRWNRFGPFQVPFGAEGRRAGTFTGLVRGVNVTNEGDEYRDENPQQFNINIEPSILITMLEPVIGYADGGIPLMASCNSPALRGFPGLPYIMQVEAIGFEPQYFNYEFSGINGSSDIVTFTHTAMGPMDRLGDPEIRQDEVVVFNSLGPEEEFYVAAITVTAIDANNQHLTTHLPLPVVRPVAFHYDGNRDIAQYYEPELVHGPIVGGIGTTITYAESHSEARQRGVSISVSKSFTESHGSVQNTNWSEGFSTTESNSNTNTSGQTHSEGATASQTYGTGYSSSDSNSVNFNTTDGNTWGWNTVKGQSAEEFNQASNETYGTVSAGVSTEVSGEGSIPGFAKVGGKVGTNAGVTAGSKDGAVEGSKTGTSESQGYNMGGSSSESQGFGSTTTDTKSESLSGSYGVSSQSTINNSTSETQASSQSTTYQMGGSEGLTENYSTGNQETWQETWQTTSTDTTLLSFSGKVPNGRCAVVYRQTVRHVRTAHLYSYDLCGVREHMGEMYFNEWSWSPNIAIGNDCDVEIPPSTLPKASCFEACD